MGPKGLWLTFVDVEYNHDATKVVARYPGRVDAWTWVQVDGLRWHKVESDWFLMVDLGSHRPTPAASRHLCPEGNLSRRQWREFSVRVAEAIGGRVTLHPAVPEHPRPWWGRPHDLSAPRCF
ncbi:hypothetical protein GCM10023205_03770 [Yinghuangia aomiensis]|uniref:Uncharacterized protein n=1 Tax=Yinghuangia aomiensis TaxID=676205 RepID=A0ABP9GM69_9ACTN